MLNSMLYSIPVYPILQIKASGISRTELRGIYDDDLFYFTFIYPSLDRRKDHAVEFPFPWNRSDQGLQRRSLRYISTAGKYRSEDKN